ncbi:M23 family metallopeptidase [Sinanaerobacter sp. ZZT-01]|uniref:M23 family metallopeptidase n=1 Tax=Sinanaerobacter sp. ZZT-01 TaxID=3111540 RepID=UPI002D79E2CA|nr:M23 family metallopeptidase [Sinanaerobacter sp. ZZT-01]WRR93082.1 M23 family metallopeptidase [Sinanaerobacter sp. ZZT-01]
MMQRYDRWGLKREKRTWMQTLLKQILISILILLLVILIKKLDLALLNETMQTFQTYIEKDYTSIELIDSGKAVFSNAIELPKKVNEKLKESEKTISFVPPADEEAIISTFGEKKAYFGTETNGFERGMKFSSDRELQVYAVAGGTVAEVQENAERGTTLQISHGDQIDSRYEGCTQVYVKPLQKVKRGQLIASVSADTGNYLSFQLWVDQEIANPADYISF